ncbi:MAG: threonylcarbamoyl-AMP synthase [Melioribacteraceae bacterium]|nr:threonylcarbamoyl-AMP synthase [Melioribacteraceae bacterium]
MILKPSKENILKAAREIKAGNVVAFPTETVYGLGADGTNPIAVSKIFEVKNRPSFNPLIVHICEMSQLYEVSEIYYERIEILAEKFWPGPLTLVLPKKKIIPDIVTAGHPTVAVRMPAHEVALSLIKESGVPIAAPSANSFGFLSPTSSHHVEKQLGDKIDFILDGGSSSVGVESTIIEFEDSGIKILRPGGLPIEDIAELIPEVEILNGDSISPKAPGMLLHHYAPSVKLKFFDEADTNQIIPEKTGALYFSKKKLNTNFKAERILSESGDMREAAANLFKFLHELENTDIELILAERIPETGLGIAIMDRLTRAANKYR